MSFWDALGGIGGALGGAGSLIGGIGGIVTADQNNKINKENLEFQKQAYQENLNQMNITRGREDTAVQRRVADLKAAGLSPVLAAGQAAQSQAPISLKAPQRDYNQNVGAGAAAAGQGMQAALTQSANIASTVAQLGLLEQQKNKAAAEASIAWHDANFWNQHPDSPSTATGVAKNTMSLMDVFKKLTSPDKSPLERLKGLDELNHQLKLEQASNRIRIENNTNPEDISVWYDNKNTVAPLKIQIK